MVLEEKDQWLNQNNSDELIDFELSSSDITRDVFALTFISLGIISDILIIYMIARNKRMRNKPNYILMNYVINDAFCLLSNARYLQTMVHLIGSHLHGISNYMSCAIRFTDIGFQINQAIFLLFLLSNTLIKNNRIQVRWLVPPVYILMVVNFFLNLQFCDYKKGNVLHLMANGLFFLNIVVIVVKELNGCYKQWYKKDPLTPETLFRLNIGRIYGLCWFFSYFVFQVVVNFVTSIIVYHYLMTSLYILAYIVCADKNFKACFMGVVKCKRAEFCEDEVRTEVNINFDEHGKPVNV